jgi:crotonobetainyl-CoA:carnitine CoA-transferase CaiB-like acyl-CoA transferase
MGKPFAGLKVLDLTEILAGPMVGAYLGDMGADVVKVERGGGDSIRVNKQTELIYIQFNRSKRGIVLDHKTPAGLEGLLRMAAQADIFIENSRPGVADRRGYGYEAVRVLNPGIIYCSISAFGSSGPYAQRAANDWIMQGVSGLMSWTGAAGGDPVRLGPPIADYAGGSDAIIGILTALHVRDRTGEGQKVDVSLLDSSLYVIGQRLMHFPAYGQPLRPMGNRHPWAAPAEAYRTADGWIHVVVQDEWRWLRFCTAIERPDLADDERFRDNRARIQNIGVLNEILIPLFATRPSSDWVRVLADDADQMVGVQQNLEQVLADMQVRHNGTLVNMPYPGYPDLPLIDTPVRLSSTPGGITRRAPLLGEHTEEVLREYGFSPEEISALDGS